MAGSTRVFSVEFREKAVAYVVEKKKSIAAAARELVVGESTLGSWVTAARDSDVGGVLSGPVPAPRSNNPSCEAHA